MDQRDRQLGMDRAISRRDLLGGAAVTIGAALIPACGRSSAPSDNNTQAPYTPRATKMRGSHPGSFEAAHSVVQGQSWEAEHLDEHYDLVVVGAGISGLTAAYIHRRDINPDARILIVDNHDDFGGHAKRNEFELDGKKLIGFGGTMLMESTRTYPVVAKQIVEELGIPWERNSDFYRSELFESHGMNTATFFDEKTFSKDHLAISAYNSEETLNEAPLSENAKTELKRLFADEEDYLTGKTPAERRAILESMSWRDYLKTYGGFSDEALTYIQKRPHGVWAIGADAFPAFFAWIDGYPGFAGMDLGIAEDEESDNYGGHFYFPDGNASVARALVQKLIPQISNAESAISLVNETLDYATLDRPDNNVRIRLSSTVIELKHRDGALNGDVDVTYVRDNKAKTLSASKVIWAGYHAMLPYICDEIPAEQVNAFRSSVRAPLVYTNVLIRNWQSFANLGFWRAYCPGSFFQSVRVMYPISMGGYEFAQTPDDPVLLHLQHIPVPGGDMAAPEQFRDGRRKLLETPFETFERNVRDQLDRMLKPGGFDAATDIAGITVNRWPHGYAYSTDPSTDEVAWWPEFWRGETKPWEIARSRIGNIAIAGTDASSNAMTESAMEEAHRAVHSLHS